MAMTLGSDNKATINVTPMIDVLLVLLIIFMVVIHIDNKGLDARLPQPSNSEAPSNPEDIVLLVRDDLSVTLNQEVVSALDLTPRLAQLYKVRGDHLIFVGGSPDLAFENVLHVIDVARGVGLTRIAFLPKDSL